MAFIDVSLRHKMQKVAAFGFPMDQGVVSRAKATQWATISFVVGSLLVIIYTPSREGQRLFVHLRMGPDQVRRS